MLVIIRCFNSACFFLCPVSMSVPAQFIDVIRAVQILGRIIRVDHCDGYKQPKDHNDTDDVTRRLRDEGCAPKVESSSSAEEEEEEELKLLPVKVKVKKGEIFLFINSSCI